MFFKKTLNLSYKRVRRDTARKPDPALYEQKKKELDILKDQAFKGEIDLEYFDESGFNLNPNLPYAWNPIGETLSIPAKMSKNLNVLGFFNKNKSTLFASTTYDKVDTEVVIGHFNLFVDEIKAPTVAVVDNASIHTSKKFQEMLPIWKEKGLTVFYLPPYSPQLNPIEMVWKFMKYYWIE
ncbi:IS630 family transposase, partial [Sulfurimonas sp. SAG-AH-194-C21]